MHINRSNQLAMLNALAMVYPRYTTKICEIDPTEADLVNLWYLKEQELVEGALDMSLGQSFIFQGVKITAKGLDFLADDGGLSAILGTVTVRIHADSIKELLISKINSSDATPDRKTWFRSQLETGSSETIKRITNSILDYGIKNAPDLLSLVEKAIR